MTIVVIGGDAAGMSASSRIARKAKDAHVIVYEKTDTISYGACGLPFYIGGLNDDINLVKILSPEQARKTGVDLKLRHEVTAVDTGKKQVTVHDLEKDETFVQSYDKLMIATGSARATGGGNGPRECVRTQNDPGGGGNQSDGSARGDPEGGHHRRRVHRAGTV